LTLTPRLISFSLARKFQGDVTLSAFKRNETFALISVGNRHGLPFRHTLQAMKVRGERRAV
jgi:hypothetical protein